MRRERQGSPSSEPIRQAGLCAVLAIALWLVTLKPMAAQGMPTGPHDPSPPPMRQRLGGGLDDNDNGANDPVEVARRLRALNEMRQKSIVSDTNKLVKLANELNTEVGGVNFESLTPDQLRKLATIEKLAHSVKEKMSTPVGGSPAYQLPQPPMMR